MAETNLVIKQGATWNQVLSYTDSSGTPINLTSYTAKLQLKETCKSTFSYLTISTETGEIVIDGPTGTITITVDATVMTRLPSGTYLYDLIIISPASTPVVTRLLEGKITVSPEVTVR